MMSIAGRVLLVALGWIFLAIPPALLVGALLALVGRLGQAPADSVPHRARVA